MNNGSPLFRGYRPLVAAAMLAIVAGALLLRPDRDRQPAQTRSAAEPRPPASAPEEKLPVERKTARPPPAPATEEALPGASAPLAPFELDAIAAALARLSFDAGGEPQLDDNARAALHAAFLRPERPLDGQQLAELLALVRAGLPEPAGERAASVAQRFYHYSNAYRDIRTSFDHQGSPDELRRGFRQLSNLRRDYLGESMARQLYGEEERQMRYTLESMRIQSDQRLGDAEKRERQRELRARLQPTAAATSR